MNCNRCKLSEYRSRIVTGRGTLETAHVLLIGEAPGLSEDVLGKAFVGEAGKLLDEMLVRAGVKIDNCFFTNTVFCRPCNFRGDRINRVPMKEEVLACLPNVQEQISRMTCLEHAVFVGRTSETYYRSKLAGVHSVHITHPSAILKNGGRSSPLFTEAVNTLRRAALAPSVPAAQQTAQQSIPKTGKGL